MFKPEVSGRSTWPVDVRYNGGKIYARCQDERTGKLVADALNAYAALATPAAKPEKDNLDHIEVGESKVGLDAL